MEATARTTWTGLKLYAGIDVHKAKWVVTVRTRETVPKTFVTGADKQALLRSFEHLFAGGTIEAVYEASCSGYHLAQFLNEHGVKTIIVAPHTIPVAPGQFVKTDVLDSRKLALELAIGSLTGIYLRPPRRPSPWRRGPGMVEGILSHGPAGAGQERTLKSVMMLFTTSDLFRLRQHLAEEIRLLGPAFRVNEFFNDESETWNRAVARRAKVSPDVEWNRARAAESKNFSYRRR